MSVPFELHLSKAADPVRTEPRFGASEAQYRLLVDNVQDYAIFMLDLTGQISTWNRGAERLFGYPEAEVLGQPGAIIFTDEDRAINAPRQEMDTAPDPGRSPG
jgi:two-component system CheB/CheR fusion protein